MVCTSGVVIVPSASTLAPLIRGEPDMVGLLLGSRELLCLCGRTSRTLVCCRSLPELCLPGESASCQIQGESVGWWDNIIFSPGKTGVFRGARHVTPTSSHPGVRHLTSLPTTDTVVRHVTSLPPTKVQCLLCDYLSASFYLRRFNRCSYSA